VEVEEEEGRGRGGAFLVRRDDVQLYCFTAPLLLYCFSTSLLLLYCFTAVSAAICSASVNKYSSNAVKQHREAVQQ
jgi:hypothetical protein